MTGLATKTKKRLKDKIFTIEYDKNLEKFVIFENVSRNLKVQAVVISEKMLKKVLGIKNKKRK